MHRQNDAVTVAGGLEGRAGFLGVGAGGMGRGRGRGCGGCGGGFAQAFDGVMQRAFGQRVGYEIIGPQAQQLVQRNRADLISDQDHLDPAALGLADDVGDPRQVRLVFAIHRDGDELKRRGIGLAEEHRGILERQIAPAFAQLQFHVVDQQIEILHVARNGARHDGGRFRRQICHARHRLCPSKDSPPNDPEIIRRTVHSLIDLCDRSHSLENAVRWWR